MKKVTVIETRNSHLHMTCEGSYSIASGSGTDLRNGVIKLWGIYLALIFS